jgi:hypothetical protein
MKTAVIRPAASSTFSRQTIFCAAVRVRQWTDAVESTCAAADWRLRRAVTRRKEAPEHRLQEFVLELLAAIVLIVLFMIVTDSAASEDC